LILSGNTVTIKFQSLLFSDEKMTIVRKLKICLVGIISAIFLLFNYTGADTIQVEGDIGSTVTAYITKRLSSSGLEKDITYKMFFPESFTETVNTQNISRLRKSYAPAPATVNELKDDFGNSSVELTWNKNVRIIQIDLQFNAVTLGNFTNLSSEAPFPVILSEGDNIYLTTTKLSPADDFYINYIGRALSYNLNRQIDVVNSIFIWLDKNIRLSNLPENSSPSDALSVLQKLEGDDKGVSNLAAAIFKGIGIPVRVVKGVSFQKEIIISINKQKYIYDHSNNTRYWVEIYFPDIGWISYDPRGMHFGVTSHLVKFSAGPDSDYVSGGWGVSSENVDIQEDYIYDIKADFSNLKFQSFKNNSYDKIVLSPVVSVGDNFPQEPSLEIEGLQLETTPVETETGATGIFFDNSTISQSLDIVATRNKVYAQKVNLEFPITVTEIRLPLVKFGDEGNIWVDIFSDKDGIPGERLFRTYRIDSTRLRFMMIENPWLTFPVGKKTASFLESGSYWLALRSSGTCIFNWYASEGNVFGTKDDTRYMDVSRENRLWNHIMNFDMNFQLIGRREEVKE
jgi:transglutaminase-like putative cysteine protease